MSFLSLDLRLVPFWGGGIKVFRYETFGQMRKNGEN